MNAKPEFYRPVAVERIGGADFSQHIEATDAERDALARRLGIPALAMLACDFRLRRAGQGVIFAEARLQARASRVCVVSLDEFETGVAFDFRVRFVPAALESEAFDLEADDEIPYEANEIDLGEAAVQELVLALDPYPRKPDAELPGDAGEAVPSPFTVLRPRGRAN